MTGQPGHRRSLAFSVLFASVALAGAAQDNPDWQRNYDAGVKAFQAAQYADAVQALEIAHRQAQAFPAGDIRRLENTPVLAYACLFAGNLDRSEALFQEARAVLEAPPAKEKVLLAYTLDGLSQLRYQQGRWSESVELLVSALRICTEASGLESVCAITVMRHLGDAYATLGQLADAERVLSQTVEIFRRTPSLPETALATTLRNLGGVYLLQGRYADAEPLVQESLQLSSKLGTSDLAYADSILSMGRLYRLRHDPARALPLLNKAERLFASTRDIGSSVALQELAMVALDQKKYAMARDYLTRAKDFIETHYGAGHITLAFIKSGLAECYLGERNYAEAAALIGEALNQERKALPGGHSEIARAHMIAGLIDERQRHAEEADSHYREALQIYRNTFASDNPDLRRAELAYSRFTKSFRK